MPCWVLKESGNSVAKFLNGFVLSSLGTAVLLCCATATYAQSANNVLGLPAVPQAPLGAAAIASAAKAPTAPVAPSDAEIKSILSGNISLASFYQEGLITVRVVTTKVFVGSAMRTQAIQAAKLVQRDVRLACGKLCKPGPMPAPLLLAGDTLSFELVISGYAGTLSTADMVNLVNAKAIGPGGKAVPVAVPVLPNVSASTATANPATSTPGAAVTP